MARAIVVAASLLASVGRATVMVPMSDDVLVRTSDVIIVGNVQRIETALLDGGRVVTRITVGVELTLKGAPGSSVLVTEPGGDVGGRRVIVWGTPSFRRGERVLLFLRLRRDGTLSTNALGLGKYELTTGTASQAIARRPVPHVDERPVATFVGRIAALAAGQNGVRADGHAGSAVTPAVRAEEHPAFRFLGVTPLRWWEADCGLPVVFSPTNADADFGQAVSHAALEAGAAAWNMVDGASLILHVGAATAAGRSVISGTTDGNNTLVYNDPLDEIADLDGCLGIYAATQTTGSADATFGFAKVVGGITFGRIFEADVVVNPSIAQCLDSSTGLDGIVAHELGHAIGFAHSSDDPREPDPVLKDALMYGHLVSSSRGATLRADDVAGLRAAYPESVQSTTAMERMLCLFELGLFTVDCFGQSLKTRPFTRFEKAKVLADKAATRAKPEQQRKLLKRALKVLRRADAVAANRLSGQCHRSVHARLTLLRDWTSAAIADLPHERRSKDAKLKTRAA